MVIILWAWGKKINMVSQDAAGSEPGHNFF